MYADFKISIIGTIGLPHRLEPKVGVNMRFGAEYSVILLSDKIVKASLALAVEISK